MFDPESLQIAVAFIKFDQGRILLAWNSQWQSFGLPMTKIKPGPPAESPTHAAIRAAAEIAQLPIRSVPVKANRTMRALQLSGRDGEIRNYCFTLVDVEIHPDFRATLLSNRTIILASIDKLASGEYQPLSPTVKPILDECLESGWF